MFDKKYNNEIKTVKVETIKCRLIFDVIIITSKMRIAIKPQIPKINVANESFQNFMDYLSLNCSAVNLMSQLKLFEVQHLYRQKNDLHSVRER